MRDPSTTPLERLDPAESWAPWEPNSGDPWGRKWAGHLYRRAAFGASWIELESAIAAGPESAIARLLEGGPGHEDFDRVMDALAPEPARVPAVEGLDGPLQGWWLHRIVRTPHPLREKLCLFWHDHFATSVHKVRRPDLMARQNLLIREHALGKFGSLDRLMELRGSELLLLKNDRIRGL